MVSKEAFVNTFKFIELTSDRTVTKIKLPLGHFSFREGINEIAVMRH